VEGEFDCAELARRVQREVFGREVRIPAERSHAAIDPAHAIARWRAMQAQISRGTAECARRVEVPEEGDGVLLVARGYSQHVGVYCVVDGEPCVLHAADAHRQVVRTRVRELEIRGLRVEGYYRWT
jgi:hypothetical protein